MNIRLGKLGARGVTLTELMVASLILSGVILGGMSSFRFITAGIHQSRQKTIANNLAQEKMEVLKNMSYFQLLVTTDAYSDPGYSGVVYDTSFYPPDTISLWGLPPFKRAVHVAYAETSSVVTSTLPASGDDPGMKQITVYILWEERGSKKKVELRNLYANPTAAALDSTFNGNVTITGGGNLAGAQIKVLGAPYWKGTANTSGFYSFAVANGTYTLSCSSAGFYTVTSAQLTVSRNQTTTQDFVMTRIATGTIVGSVWISTNLVLSAVVGSTLAPSGTYHQEWVEIFNPTTYTWRMSGAVGLKYQSSAMGSREVIDIDYYTPNIEPGHSYVFSNTVGSSIAANNENVAPDAVWNNTNGNNAARFMNFAIGDNIITTQLQGPGQAGGALELYDINSGRTLDIFGWDRNTGLGQPAPFFETLGLSQNAGLEDDEQFARWSSTWAIGGGETWGPAYDSGNNSIDWSNISPVADAPRNHAAGVKPVIAGTPAIGAYVHANDRMSSSTRAVTFYGGPSNNMPYAQFTLMNVATGTWSVTITSRNYTQTISTVASTNGVITYIPNAVSTPSWPSPGYYSTALATLTTGGFVEGYVFGSGAAYNTPLSGILMESQGVNVRTTSNGYYMMNVPTGTAVVNANFNIDNDDYTTDTAVGTVAEGEATYIPASPYFHLLQGGYIKGYVTSGTGVLPNVVVKAVSGALEYFATTDYTGYFYITVSTRSTAYSITPVLDPLQSYTAQPSDPLTATVTSPGTTIHAGTFTVAGGMGTITGSVTYNGEAITTGVLIIASSGTITDPPPAIYGSSAPALSSPYYAVSSNANGTYTLEVRGSAATYNMTAFYPVVDIISGSVTYTTKTNTAVVAAGGSTSGKNFAWP